MERQFFPTPGQELILKQEVTNVMVGGTTGNERNIISGNTQNGINFNNSNTVIVNGNPYPDCLQPSITRGRNYSI